MFIGGLQKFTLIDYPGKIAAVVFLAGCNFRCPFCHNAELVTYNKNNYQNKLSKKEVLKFLSSRKGDLDGVCITGGEPTLQPGLIEFIKEIRKMGFLVKIDTNGSYPLVIKNLLENKLVDYWAMDIKTAPEKYKMVIGGKKNIENVGNENLRSLQKKLKKSIELIVLSKVEYEWRTTVAPTVVDKNDIVKMIEWLKKIHPSALKNANRYTLQQFRPDKTLDPAFQKIKPYSDDKLKKMADLLKPHCKKVVILG